MRLKMKLKKPSELLSLYSQKLNSGIEEKLSPLAFELVFKYRSPHIAHISGYVVFRTEWILEFDEILEQRRTEVIKLKYRYHLMDKSKQLLFRYDNVPHHPQIKSHPDHKHIKNAIIESSNPGLLQVVDEIEALIVKEKS